MPEVGPHPEGLRTGNEGANPPPEDPGSADGVPTGCLQRQSDGPDDQLCGLRVEVQSHPFHQLLLGGPDRFLGLGQVACGHHQVSRGNGQRKASEWTDIKELTPLQFMPYVAKLFKEVTGQDLQGLSHFTGWIGQGGYYHWRVVQQGLIHLVPHLPRQPMPRTPDAHPSGRPLPPKPAQTETLSTGASGK